MQEDGPQRIADFVRHTGRQTTQEGKVLGALRFVFETATLGHFTVQIGRTLLHPALEFGVGALHRRLYL
jgi:hypothetical protein